MYTFIRSTRTFRICHISKSSTFSIRYFGAKHNLKEESSSNLLDKLLKKHEDNLYYCSYIENNRLKMGYKRNVITAEKMKRHQNVKRLELQSQEPLPLSLKYVVEEYPKNSVNKLEEEIIEQSSQLPYQIIEKTVIKDGRITEENSETKNPFDLEIRTRLELYNKSNTHVNWMNDYENYSHDQDDNLDDWKINYGTPDPKCPTSKIPCGGCGALLHCKDTAIPGYIPSEIFKNYRKFGGSNLKSFVCQRCHFLKNYDMALQIRVSATEYPKILSQIAERKRVLVILMVDLLDFPCSIWPGIPDLIGSNQPIVVVGNKVDLLPQDGKGCLERIRKNLLNAVRESGFGMSNIKHVSLISAQTGFGVEDLITKLHHLWQFKGDVYIVGCTNVGKSSLFNALLQSDYCKSQATDLIQRATTSPWPGTTLNLLKFPILRINGWRLHARMKRLTSAKKLELQERKLFSQQLKNTKNAKYATLIGHIDRTFTYNQEPEDDDTKDVFALSQKGQLNNKFGVNEKDPEYALSKWCYDTPGVIQPDQIIHLLTTEELMKTFPKSLIRPETYSLQPGSTIFIAGLARLDYLEGTSSVRFTVFRSSNLPITICKLANSSEVYNDFIGTEVFSVPINQPERLKIWPQLEPSKKNSVTGIDKNTSCADLVLSSAGWIAITPYRGHKCVVQGWTPERRGVYLRDSLLPKAISFRGSKIRDSVAYKSNNFCYPQ